VTGEREDGMPQMGSQPLKVNDCALAASWLWLSAENADVHSHSTAD